MGDGPLPFIEGGEGVGAQFDGGGNREKGSLRVPVSVTQPVRAGEGFLPLAAERKPGGASRPRERGRLRPRMPRLARTLTLPRA